MKSLMSATLLSLLAIAAGSVYADADQNQPRDPGVNQRQHMQQERIHQGVHSGELTRQETRQLERKEHALAREEHRYKADGNLSKAERKDLHHDLNQLNRGIRHEKHDNNKRPGAR